MIYLKVKSEYDNKPKEGVKNEIYIGNELYTVNEVKKQNLNLNYLEEIKINKNKTCFCFGARLEIKESI